MPIRDKKAEKEFEAIPDRIYTHVELQDFHNKIQRFWDEPREVVLDKGMSGTARRFRYEELHVAYGAARKVEQGKKVDGSPVYYYLYNSERNRQFNNIWNQYESWRQKQDWIENRENVQLEKIAEEIPF